MEILERCQANVWTHTGTKIKDVSICGFSSTTLPTTWSCQYDQAWLPFEDRSFCLGIYREAESFLHAAIHHCLSYLVCTFRILLAIGAGFHGHTARRWKEHTAGGHVHPHWLGPLPLCADPSTQRHLSCLETERHEMMRPLVPLNDTHEREAAWGPSSPGPARPPVSPTTWIPNFPQTTACHSLLQLPAQGRVGGRTFCSHNPAFSRQCSHSPCSSGLSTLASYFFLLNYLFVVLCGSFFCPMRGLVTCDEHLNSYLASEPRSKHTIWAWIFLWTKQEAFEPPYRTAQG